MEQQKSIPHVLIFPYFAQGHINSMLKLAQLLWQSGFHITFLNSENHHNRLLRYTDIESRFTRFPGSPLFRLETITDGLPNDHNRSFGFLDLNVLFAAVNTNVRPAFRQLLISDRLKSDGMPPVTCIIADGILGFTIDVGEELGIPVISFRTISACCYWFYFCLPKVIESGEFPFNDDDLDRRVTNVTGMEGLLRRRDLPSFFRANKLSDPSVKFVEFETFNSARASAHILNTFEDLEAPILTHIRSKCPNLYTIGPLHALLKSRVQISSSSSNALWEQDRSCMTWLDSQPEKSVLYVSFGSLTKVSRADLLEFWFGLVNSGQRFLWVRRPDSMVVGEEEEDQIPVELVDGTRERGYIVGWAPQEEVLVHPSVGGFLTHNGWNSTVESLVAGVPMICWPQGADQQINSRYVSEVWKIGIDMIDMCDRSTVEKFVRDLMDDDYGKRKELMKSTVKIAEMAKKAVSEGGSSYVNFDGLVERIREMSSSVSKPEI